MSMNNPQTSLPLSQDTPLKKLFRFASQFKSWVSSQVPEGSAKAFPHQAMVSD